jgi:UPF0755 protein
MMSDDWLDPYGEDPEARERESRRAEREARRRERQDTLGEKVSEQQAGEAAGGAGSEQPAIAVESPAAGRPEVAPRGPGGGTGADPLLARRVLAAFVLVAVAALLVFGASKVIGKLGGSDPAPAPVEAAKVQELLIPEGLTRDQIAALAKDAEIKGDYEQASKSFKGFEPAKYGAEAPPNLEGFLFPATYELPKKATVDDLISRQLDAFEDNIKGVDMSYAESKNLNVYDVLKIASMVEREIQVPEERKLAAAVIYNRLRAGTPLGIDATIRYEDRNYDEPLLESRLNEETPYNTRIVPGLPPTPIANPGLASVEAAANPAKSKAFFFVVKPGTCGHVFVETEDEFLAAEAEYQAALEAEGGSPTDCP